MDESFKEAIKNANPAQFPDFTEVYNDLQEKAKTSVQHNWRQRGPFLVCATCEYEHTQFIGPLKKLTGFGEDGSPTIEDIKM